jgi:TPR repeat protein
VTRIAPLAAALLWAGAVAAEPTPLQTCDFVGSDSLSPDRTSNASSFEDFARQADKVADACRKAVEMEPKAGRLHAQLARALALTGDSAGALKEARIGSDLGSPMAANLLGAMVAGGEGVARDYAAALALFREAAKKGHPHAHFNLGVMLANGWGVAADDGEAAAEFNKAAAGRDPQAMLVLGDLYARGRGVAADPAQAERWLKRAAEQAETEGHRNPARVAPLGRAEPDKSALLAWYEERARAGELWARTYMGALYESGQWVKQDYAAAIAWYEKAGEAGDGLAQRRMAALYFHGWGVPQDPAQSRRWAVMGMDQRCDALARADPGANECDRLAGDRFDPNKVVEGTTGYCMARFASRAIPACTRAVAEFPSTVRFRAQLARALAHAGRFDEARREAALAAAKGSTSAMVLLGAMSERGLGVPKDEAGALGWYRRAAELDDERAMQLAMNDAHSGIGVAKGSPEAKALFDAMSNRFLEKRRRQYAASNPANDELARAEKGDVRTQHNLASRLERERKYDEAVKWYTRAAEQGFGASQLNLAQMYETGMGVKENDAEAKKWYRRSAEAGDGEALYRLAVLSDRTGDPAEAARLYGRGVAHDDYRAMLGLGELYEHGRGVRKDMARAVQLYERAADRSNWAQFKLGVLYYKGEGIPKDRAKAIQWWKKAADGGNAKAQNNVGVMYDRGLGVPRDYGQALERYLAAREVPQAIGNLEDFFEEGRGAPSLPIAAAAWYRKGADARVASAQYKLGTFYAKGHGVLRDDCKAMELLAAAQEQGYPKGREELSELLYAMGEAVEKGERPSCGLLPATAAGAQAAEMFYAQAVSLGNKRAADALAAKYEKAGDSAKAANVRELSALAAAAPRPERPKWPTGFNLDPGADQQRAIRLRIAGVAQAQAATMDPEIFNVIQWWPGMVVK